MATPFALHTGTRRDGKSFVANTAATGTPQAVQQEIEITIAGAVEPNLPKIVDVTVAGTLEPITTEEYQGTVAGATTADQYDVLADQGGVPAQWRVWVAVGMTDNDTAAAIEDAVNLGTVSQYSFAPGGTIDAGDTYVITTGGTAGPYTHVSAGGGGAAAAAVADLAVQMAADPEWTVFDDGAGALHLVAKVRGSAGDLNPNAAWTVDAGGDATTANTQLVMGVDTSTHWTASAALAVVTFTYNTPGPTVDGLTTSVTGTGTFVSASTVTGEAADVASVTLGTTVFNVGITAAHLSTDDVAEDLRALIHAHANFSATRLGSVVTVTGLPAVSYAAADSSVNNRTGGVALSCTPATTQASQSGDVARVHDGRGNIFSYSVAVTDLNTDDIATGLAAVINAHADFSALSAASIVTVLTINPAVSITFSDISTQGSGGGAALTATPNETVAGHPALDHTSEYVFDIRPASTIDLVCQLNAGTSYVVTPWLYYDVLGVWVAGANSTINNPVEIVTIAPGSADHMYVQMGTFVGGADGTIGAQGR